MSPGGLSSAFPLQSQAGKKRGVEVPELSGEGSLRLADKENFTSRAERGPQAPPTTRESSPSAFYRNLDLRFNFSSRDLDLRFREKVSRSGRLEEGGAADQTSSDVESVPGDAETTKKVKFSSGLESISPLDLSWVSHSDRTSASSLLKPPQLPHRSSQTSNIENKASCPAAAWCSSTLNMIPRVPNFDTDSDSEASQEEDRMDEGGRFRSVSVSTLQSQATSSFDRIKSEASSPTSSLLGDEVSSSPNRGRSKSVSFLPTSSELFNFYQHRCLKFFLSLSPSAFSQHPVGSVISLSPSTINSLPNSNTLEEVKSIPVQLQWSCQFPSAQVTPSPNSQKSQGSSTFNSQLVRPQSKDNLYSFSRVKKDSQSKASRFEGEKKKNIGGSNSTKSLKIVPSGRRAVVSINSTSTKQHSTKTSGIGDKLAATLIHFKLPREEGEEGSRISCIKVGGGLHISE